MIRTARLPRLPHFRLPRARYLALPAAALIVVIGAQALNLSHGQPVPVVPQVPISVPAPGDVTLPGDASAVGGVDTADVDKKLAFWQNRLRAIAGNTASNYQVLGDLLALKGRLTGDLSNYTAAETAYRTAVGMAPKDAPSLVGLARILSTLHQFPEAIDEAGVALSVDSAATAAVSVLFDASVEVGRLTDADAAIALLAKRGADDTVINVRQARLDFLRGDSASAVTLSERARASAISGGSTGEELAFYDYAAGEYEFLAGNYAAAGSAYDASALALPGYVFALYGQARAEYALGDTTAAIGHLKQAVAIVPRPDVVAYLGDLLAQTGDTAGAEQQYRTVDFIAALGTTPGQVYNREYALFLAGHSRNTANAVQLAAAELQNRKDIYGYDAYAWALYADGQFAAALQPMQNALSLGTGDARLFEHAGLIELANGMQASGRAHLQQALARGLAYEPLGQARVQAALAK